MIKHCLGLRLSAFTFVVTPDKITALIVLLVSRYPLNLCVASHDILGLLPENAEPTDWGESVT